MIHVSSSPWLPRTLNSLLLLANAINWFDPATGTTVVYNPGDIAWTLASTALVWLMIPGVGYFYSGLLRRKNALSMIYLSMMSIAIVSFQVRAFTARLALVYMSYFSGSSGGFLSPSATLLPMAS
jgi:hypothetical protein